MAKMGRPKKDGLRYFQLDVDVFQDEKFIAVIQEYGNEGIGIYIRLLSLIYKNGYFLKWDSSSQKRLAYQLDATAETVNQIVELLTSFDFFDRAMLDNGVLTGAEIQRHYFSMRRRLSAREFPYLLPEVEPPVISPVKVDFSPPTPAPEAPNELPQQSPLLFPLQEPEGNTEEPEEEALTEFQVTLNDGSVYVVPQAKFDKWKRLYPKVDIARELRKIEGWNDANPRKRKTRRGIEDHINSWLAREQDSCVSIRPRGRPSYRDAGISYEQEVY